MAKKPTTKRRAEGDSPVHAAFAEHAEGFNPPEREQRPPEPTVADLMAKLAVLESELAKTREENLAALTVPTQAPMMPEPPKPVNFDGLPDPIQDPAGYAKELNSRIVAANRAEAEYNAQVSQSRQANEDRLKAVLDNIAIAHPEIAGDPQKLDFIAGTVVQRAIKRGIDKDRYVFGNQQRFIEDVAREYKATFRLHEEGEGTDEEEDEGTAPTARRAGDRGLSIHGGLPTGAPKGRTSPAPTSNFMQEIAKMQEKMGL